MRTRMTLERNRLVHEHGVAARLAATRVGRIHVEDRALAPDLRGQHREADEAGLALAGRDREHRLAPALEPALAGPDHVRRAVGHRDLEPPAEQAPDAAATVTMTRGHAARLEVDAVTAHEPGGAAREIERMLEQDAAARGRRGLPHHLDAIEPRAVRPGPRLVVARAQRGDRRARGA